MLNSIRSMTVCGILTLGLVAAGITSASADDPTSTGDVTQCANQAVCGSVTDHSGSTPSPGATLGGSGGGGGGVQMCSWNGQQWPCWDDDLGWFSTSDGCYYQASDPQPPADDPAWAGHMPTDGAVYEVNCRGVGGQLTPKPLMFFAAAPVAQPPRDRPIDIARRTVKQMHFDSPTLHAAPAGTAVVGSPVWLWYDATPTTDGVQTKKVDGLGLSITITATRGEVSWDPGDGSSTFGCKDSVTPYRSDLPRDAVPPCGYTYRTSSAKAKDTSFYLTAKFLWHVEATRSDTGAVFYRVDIPVDTQVPLKLQVAEVQVLN
ncbi:hypothetical protein [Kitasatospora cinereorecta]|uniref:ATP/GTP-binding protein n=1 Tax=Kitasatospora cinereorecta TaxID=285560 RepID=A0ABW0VM38_9ACTN